MFVPKYIKSVSNILSSCFIINLFMENMVAVLASVVDCRTVLDVVPGMALVGHHMVNYTGHQLGDFVGIVDERVAQ